MMPKTAKNQQKIVNFLNEILFKRAHFPRKFQESRLKLIEKTPPSDSGKLRPLCIGQRLSAMLGRIMAARAQPLIDKDKTYTDRYGFRVDLGCEELLGSVFDTVTSAKTEGFDVALC